MNDLLNRIGIQQVAGNYPDRWGLGQQFANDYWRSLEEHERQKNQARIARMKARRKSARKAGYRPSRPT